MRAAAAITTVLILVCGCGGPPDELLDRLFLLRKQREDAVSRMDACFSVGANKIRAGGHNAGEPYRDEAAMEYARIEAIHRELVDLLALLKSRYNHDANLAQEHDDHLNALRHQVAGQRACLDALQSYGRSVGLDGKTAR